MRTNSKKVKNGKKLIVWGYVLVGIAVFCLFAGSPVESGLQASLLYGGIGVVLLFFGYRRKNTLAMYAKNENKVVRQGEARTGDMANASGLPQSKQKQELRQGLQTNSRKAKNGKNLIVWGYVLVAMELLSVYATGISDLNFPGLLLFGGTGAALLFFGYRRKNTLAMYAKNENKVVQQGKARADQIATASGLPHSNGMDVLRKMIELGYFPGAYIDENLQEIVLPKHTQEQHSSKVSESVLKCPSCGANNKIVAGKVTECEWCGTPIK